MGPALEELVLSRKDFRHRVVDEDAADRVREDVGAGELRDEVGGAPWEGHGVGDDDPVQRALLEDVERLPGEEAVCGDREDAIRSGVEGIRQVLLVNSIEILVLVLVVIDMAIKPGA